MRCSTALVSALCLSALAACSNEDTLAMAASSGKLTAAELHDATASVRAADALQKAPTEEQKTAILSKYMCEISYERRRSMWLGKLGAPEHSAYLRSDPVSREAYWKQISQKFGCAF